VKTEFDKKDLPGRGYANGVPVADETLTIGIEVVDGVINSEVVQIHRVGVAEGIAAQEAAEARGVEARAEV